jgi:hypothetical protein
MSASEEGCDQQVDGVGRSENRGEELVAKFREGT